MRGVLMIPQRLLAGEESHALWTRDSREVHLVMVQFALELGEHSRTVLTREDRLQQRVILQMVRHRRFIRESHATVEASEWSRVAVFVHHVPLIDVFISKVRLTLCTVKKTRQRFRRSHRLRIGNPLIRRIERRFWRVGGVYHFESEHLSADFDS